MSLPFLSVRILLIYQLAFKRRESRKERETTEHSPTRAQPGSQEAPPPAGGEVGISKSKRKAKLVAVVGAVCNCGAAVVRCCRGGPTLRIELTYLGIG